MGTANFGGKVATWLELAVAPEWRRNDFKVRVHALGSEERQCYALSMNNRWVCSGTGGLTVLHGLKAVHHFLELLHIDQFESGDAADESLADCGQRYCLCTDTRDTLLPCQCGRSACKH